MARPFDTRAIKMRFSVLKHMAKAPVHVLDAMKSDNGEIEPMPDTRPMRVGFVGHALLLGGEFTVWPGQRRGKKWDEFEAAHANDRIVTQSEYDDARRIADAVLSHSDAAELLNGEREKELEWSVLGRQCVGHLDVLNREHGRVVDVKTCMTSHPDRFAKQAMWMGYHAQLAWYLDGAKVRDAYVIAVESKRPYPVTVLKLSERAIEQGRKLCRLWMERFLACEEAGRWPGYCESIVPFDVPDDDDLALTFAAEQSEAILMGDD